MSYEIGSSRDDDRPGKFADNPERPPGLLSGRARMLPPVPEGLDINSCLRLVDAIRATLSASWTPGEKADAATVRQAMATLELLERRLAAHR